MAPTRKPPTMIDIAQKAGLSPMTVSRAFRNDGSVSEKARELVMKAADELGYVFDTTASNLRSQKSDFVAVTIPSINNANFADTLRGLSEGLRDQGLQPLLAYTDYDIVKEEELVGQLLQRKPAAIVVTGGNHTPKCRRMLENAAIPVVEIWDLPADPLGHVVGFSNANALGMIVDHLIAQGRKRIAFIGGDGERDTRGADRRLGFIAAMKHHGLSPNRLISAGVPPISMREGSIAMARLLKEFPDSEAVICVSDLSAFGALSECLRRGIKVPDNIALCGFGNYEIAGTCVPSLTTVDPFPYQIGEKVAQVIGRALNDQSHTLERHQIRPQLIARESSS